MSKSGIKSKYYLYKKEEMNKVLIFLFCLLIFSCKQNDGFDFEGENQIYIASGDSTIFSFAVKPQNYKIHEIRIPIRITGSAASMDREILVEVNQERTLYAKEGLPNEGGHYTIEKCILAKDSVNTVLVVRLYRDNIKNTMQEMGREDENMTLAINIIPVGDFLGGMGEEELKYIIAFNDRLTIPANWIYLQPYFGVPSLVKYQFIIDVLGISEFSTFGENKYEPGELYYFQDKMRVALIQYNKEHPDAPLVDENGNRVTF